jgi:dihydrofolate synthase/folylpolyglutamate synthase
MKPLLGFGDFERFLSRFTNYERVASFSYNQKTLGLERMRVLTRAAASPERSYPAVHIAGTKGKGSTSLMLEALLAAEGYVVGTYTSPHVEDLRERIRIAGASVSEEEIVREANGLLPYLEAGRREKPDSFPSFFEIMTALAMCSFRSHGVDWGIFEVGLGGRLDATNVLEPRWSAITSIGLEHTKQLGSTLAEIAREKGGIIKPETPLVVGSLPEEAAREIRRLAAERGAPLIEAPPDAVRRVGRRELSIRGLGDHEGSEAVLSAGPVLGPALRADLAIALVLLARILEAEGRRPSAAGVERALSSLVLPARAEVLGGSPEVVIDGAHTEESVRALRLTLEEIGFPRERTLVFSLSSDKQVNAILREAGEIADSVILTRSDSVRSISPGVLREELGKGEVIEEPEAAFEAALERGLAVVVTGSFYLAGRLRALARRLSGQTWLPGKTQRPHGAG